MEVLTEATKQEIVTKILAARENRDEYLVNMKQRQQEGLEIARKCANFLKQKYGVTKVVLFGSLLNHEDMNPHSDIDLAVWDLPEQDYFKAVGFLIELANSFSIDLVEVQNVRPYILEAIQEGLEL